MKVGDIMTLGGMLDSGSMACTVSGTAMHNLLTAGAVCDADRFSTDVTLIGVGGRRVCPKSAFHISMEINGCKMRVPTIVVEGQHDDLIIGTNVIKHLLRESKKCSTYWTAISAPSSSDTETEHFLSMLAGLHRWGDGEMPEKIGTVRCNSATCLEPGREYLLWGKLPKPVRMSPGSAAMTEPTSARSAPKGLMVARVVTPLWGDGWVPLKVMNVSEKPLFLRRNAKLADLVPCVALEDLDLVSAHQSTCDVPASPVCPDVRSAEERLQSIGLGELDVSKCDVSSECKDKLSELIVRYQDIFSRNHLDCGKAKDFVHRIHLIDQKPFRLPFRRVPPSQYQKLRQVLSEMEEKEIIRKSTSEYASPLVLIWKKNGDLRVCTDFRWLNKRTLRDAHPLPHQADCLAALGGNSLFSTMDLTSEFYNMPLHEDDRKYSAFTTPMGLYEYNRLPQGLCNSPGSFMRMMTSIFGDQNYLSLLCYLDDILVFAPDESTALDRLQMVFSRLRAHNLKLAPRKCHFLRGSVKFLGHIIDEHGVSTDPDKVECINNMTVADLMEADGVTPSEKRVRSFMGMLNFYQHFIPGYSSLAKPLFSLLAGQKQKKGRKSRCAAVSRKLRSDDWTVDHDQAFAELKSALVHSVVLAHPDFGRPFLLSTDASLDGLGAVLSQVLEGDTVARPIAFASKSLARSQKNYPAHRLEFLALKWAVCEKFSHWLKGHDFTVWTDNNPLTHMMTKPKLDCCEQRWVAKLASYNFDIKYVPGPRNTVADALSRVPFCRTVGYRLVSEPLQELIAEAAVLSDTAVQQTLRESTDQSVMAGKVANFVSTNAQSLQLSSQSLSDQEVAAVIQSHTDWASGARSRAAALVSHLPQLIPDTFPSLPAFSVDELRHAQSNDESLSRIRFYVERSRRPSRRERAREPSQVLRLLKHWEKFVLSDDVLYRVSRDQISKTKRYQFVVPDCLKAEVLKGVHESAGHQGQSRTLSIARQRFFWLHMDRDVRTHVRHCQRCIVSKVTEPAGRAPLESIVTSRPLQLVCIDFWSAEDSHNKSVDVLVITDHFTRLAQAFACRDQSAKQVAKVLWEKYFCVYGFPERIHSDQGPSFVSELIAEFLQLSGVRKSHTTPYHPMGNGCVERFNRTLGCMIRALPPESKLDWPRRLQTLTFMYNCTAHETTGYAPFYLMFGRVPRLPVDMLFGNVLSDPDVSSFGKYVTKLSEDLREAMQIAQEHAKKEQGRQTRLYNRAAKGPEIGVGDRVLVANKKERGKRKVADRWESTIYTVTELNPQTHTYKIQDTATGRERVVHRNLLMLVNFLPVQDMQRSTQSNLSMSSAESSASVSSTVSGHAASEHSQDRVPSQPIEPHCAVDDPHSLVGISGLESYSDILPESGLRTREWVHHLNSEDSGRAEQSDTSHTDNTVRDDISNVSDHDTAQSVVTSASVVDTECTDHPAPHRTTRLGRVVRPVNRLLHTMARQDVTGHLRCNVRTMCSSVVQALRA